VFVASSGHAFQWQALNNWPSMQYFEFVLLSLLSQDNVCLVIVTVRAGRHSGEFVCCSTKLVKILLHISTQMADPFEFVRIEVVAKLTA